VAVEYCQLKVAVYYSALMAVYHPTLFSPALSPSALFPVRHASQGLREMLFRWRESPVVPQSAPEHFVLEALDDFVP